MAQACDELVESPIASRWEQGYTFDQICFTRCFLLWIPAAIAAFYVKYQVFYAGEFERLAAVMGRRTGGAHAFTLGERLSFFRADFLLLLILIPIALYLVGFILPSKLRPAAGILFSGTLTMLVLVELQGYNAVGRFLGISLIMDAVRWAIDHPEDLNTYANVNRLARLLSWNAALWIVTLAALASPLWVRRRAVVRALRSIPPKDLRNGEIVFCAAALIVTSVSWLPWMRATPFHASVIGLIGGALIDPGPAAMTEFSYLPPDQLRTEYRRLTNAPVPLDRPAYWGAAKDSDVILFVFETGPAQCLASDGNLDDLPVLRRLRERSWIAPRHHTTYPVTNRAVISIIGSIYPSTGRHFFQNPGLTIPGLVQSAKTAGYESAVYMPSSISFEHELSMYKMLGMNRFAIANPRELPVRTDQQLWRGKEELDIRALRLMKEDMRRWIQKDQRYVATYLPQLAHAPWVDVVRGGEEKDLIKRGRAIMARQDALLGELVDLLEKAGRLEKTLIVVTADHGIRTNLEDPSLPMGRVDDYSFHVPLILYAPAALSSSARIPWLTSHIDIAPSVLDLLGIRAGRQFEQGSPLWDERLARRTTYFLANEYLGTDGYYDAGKFRMLSQLLGIAYSSDRLHFLDSGALPPDSPASEEVKTRINRMAALQRAWYQAAIR